MVRNVLFVLLLAMSALTVTAQEKNEAPGDRTVSVHEQAGDIQGETADESDEAVPGPEEQQQAEGAGEKAEKGAKVISGMSILGNQEAPKSLVIVPWKSSEIGNSMDISTMLDDSKKPVDREVFMRALRYYEIRSGK